MTNKTKGINAVHTQVAYVHLAITNRLLVNQTLTNDCSVCHQRRHGDIQNNGRLLPSVRNHSSISTTRLQNSLGLWVSSTCCPWYIHSVSLAKCCMLELDVKNVFKSSRQQKMYRTIAQHKTRLHNFIYSLYVCTTIIPLLQRTNH